MVKFFRKTSKLTIIIKFQPRKCPYNNSLTKLCSNPTCEVCHEKSFISHIKINYWSSINTLSPREITKKSHKKIFMKCEHCDINFICSPFSLNKLCLCKACKKNLKN